MENLQNSYMESQISSDLLLGLITGLHGSISKLECLRPSKQVNTLFTNLVNLCILPSSIDVRTLPEEDQIMRRQLICLCGKAEGLLELEFSNFLTKIPQPLNNLKLFPYYGNYVKLANLEYGILREQGVVDPKKVAFIGSGSMPLTSIIMATQHMKFTNFDNFDIDKSANDVARQIVASDVGLKVRMKFYTRDILDVREQLGEYDCIFLAALVGMNKDEKKKILGHVRKYMQKGGICLVRSANGARAFLYPIVDEDDLVGFEVLSIFHPTDDVVNSVILVQKP